MRLMLATLLILLNALGASATDNQALSPTGKGDRIIAKTAAPEAQSSKFDPSRSSLYEPKNPNAVFNAGFAWLCEYPTDVGKFRDLMATGEQQAALSMPGCVALDQPLEAIQTDSIGDDPIQVSLVKNDHTIDMWTEKRLFQVRSSWLVDECERSGINWKSCLDIVYHR